MRVKAIRDHFDGTYHKAGEEFEFEGKGKLHEHIKRAEKPSSEQTDSGEAGDKPSE